jgi:hypothetical protein
VTGPSQVETTAATPTTRATTTSTTALATTTTAPPVIAGEPCGPRSDGLLGDRVVVDGVEIVCRRVGTGLGTWLVNLDPQASGSGPPAVSNPDLCRIPDTTVRETADRALGFPRRSSVPSSGVIDLVLVPVDFAEYPGDPAEIPELHAQVEELNRWLLDQSGGQLQARWQLPDSWVRMQHPVPDYGIDTNQPATAGRIISEVIDAIDPTVDFTDVVQVFAIFPESLRNSVGRSHALSGPIVGFSRSNTPTDEGNLFRFKGIGTIAQFSPFGFPKPLWGGWAHELLHTLGLEMHSPMFGTTIDEGDTYVVSAWSSWLLGWLRPEQVACIPRGTTEPVEVDLLPLPTAGNGVRTAMIPLTETSILVIESNRDHGYQANLSSPMHERIGAYGIVGYVIDTTTREIKREYTDAGNRWVLPTGEMIRVRKPVSVGFVDSEFLLGETMRFEEISVEFVASGHTDTIRISFG